MGEGGRRIAPSLAEKLFDSFGEWESQFSCSNPSRRSPTVQGSPPLKSSWPTYTELSGKRNEKENSQLSSGKMRADMEGVGGGVDMIKILCMKLKELIKY